VCYVCNECGLSGQTIFLALDRLVSELSLLVDGFPLVNHYDFHRLFLSHVEVKFQWVLVLIDFIKCHICDFFLPQLNLS